MENKKIMKISEGAYGTVYLLDNNLALKDYKKSMIDGNNRKLLDPSILRELSSIQYLNHKDIIKPINIYVNESKTNINFTMKYHQITLHKYLEFIDTIKVKEIMYKLLKIINYCHSNFIVHRDLKLNNILLEIDNESNYTPILIDFGLAKFDFFYDDYTNQIKSLISLNEEIQTLWYRSPEVILNQKFVNYKMDIWSLGIIFLDLINNEMGLISADKTKDQLHRYLENLNYNNNFDLLNNYLKKNNFELNKKNIFEYDKLKKFDKNGIDLLKKMLNFDPEERITSLEALQHPYFKDFLKKEEEKEEIIKNNFFYNLDNLKDNNIDLDKLDKIDYSRCDIIKYFKDLKINVIIYEWLFYLVDSFVTNNDNNVSNPSNFLSFYTIRELFIFCFYLFIKFLTGDNYRFKDVYYFFNKTHPSLSETLYYSRFEIVFLGIFDFNILIKTPGLILYKYYTYLYRSGTINIEKLEEVFIDVRKLLEVYISDKENYKYKTTEIYSSIGKIINEKFNLNTTHDYLNILNDPNNEFIVKLNFN